MAKRNASFSLAVKTEGGLLPADYLLMIAALSKDIEGLTPEHYHLSEKEKLNEAINRAYSRLQGFWTSFKDTLEKLPPDDYATSATKEKWLLPLFDCLGFGRLIAAEAISIGNRQYKPSHTWSNVPIHLVGFRVDLDKRSTAGGARSSSPHSLVQELLNQSDEHLWAFVSNGRKVRLLRDNVSLTRQAYIEFDLESIFEGDGYSDFRLLWLLCHQSRVEGNQPEKFWLEQWSKDAQRTGVRVRDELRKGVEKALETLGTGFLRHRSNEALRALVSSGNITAEDYYRQLLRIIYRLLFLFVTEDRDVLLSPQASADQRRTYYNYYSTGRLRGLAGMRRGSQHDDLWVNLSFVFDQLSSDVGCAQLGLPPLGSFLWSTKAIPLFQSCRLYNADLLEALRNLCFTIESGIRRPVQYGQLESEELGSIYESLLEQIPFLDATGDLPLFRLSQTVGSGQTAGTERKTTGSYYTPTSLVNCLLDSALEPVLKRAVSSPEAEKSILDLKVCDPACGSGHFLIAAAHRIAKRLASVRSGDLEPGPEFTSKALREVISHCIYGVDVNEMAVELCKVSLWLQSTVPGMPLSFLDHKIKCGNSLLGTSPALIENGIPDAAFDPIEGDDKDVVKRIKAANRQQSDGVTLEGFLKFEKSLLSDLTAAASALERSEDLSISDVHKKEEAFSELLHSESYLHERYVADAWCSAFAWRLVASAPSPITREVFGRIRTDYKNVSVEVRHEINRLREHYRFFHWHLEFPQVFLLPTRAASGVAVAGWSSGFDVVLGNPPWERVKLQEQEFFAARSPEIATAKTKNLREKLIAKLFAKDASAAEKRMAEEFTEAKRTAEATSLFIRSSGRFPLCGRGDINTYAVFAETNRLIVNNLGRIGCILPSGIATDDTTKHFFRDLVASKTLVSLFSFENEALIFPGIHHATKFCLLTLSGMAGQSEQFDLVFFARNPIDLEDSNRHFRLSAEELLLINPNTGTCPVFRSAFDAEITKRIYRTLPILLREGSPSGNTWDIRYSRMFDMTNDSASFKTGQELGDRGLRVDGNHFIDDSSKKRYLPLYEAKMLHQFDHRFGTYEGQTEAQARQGKLPEFSDEQHADPDCLPIPQFWVDESEVTKKIEGKWDHNWLIAYRDITSAVTTRTVISSILPLCAVANAAPLIFVGEGHMELSPMLVANLCSFALDYVARCKIGGTHLNFFILNQLPVISPEAFGKQCPWNVQQTLAEWMKPRVMHLMYTASDLADFASDMGVVEPISKWDSEDRFSVRCELDAAFFFLYGLDEDSISHILDSFPLVKDKDVKLHGDYRTKQRILEKFSQMKLLARDSTVSGILEGV